MVVDGACVFAAGVTAGIDGALRLAAELRGDEAAQAIQLNMVLRHDPEHRRRDGDLSVLINSLVGLFGNAHGGSFTEAQVQTVLLTDAVTNGCMWAVAFHTALALNEGIDLADVQAIRAGRLPKDSKLAALSALARTMIEKRGRLDDEEIIALPPVGFSALPGVCLKRSLQRGLRDTAGVVRDRGRGDDGNDLQGMVLAEPGRDKSIHNAGSEVPRCPSISSTRTAQPTCGRIIRSWTTTRL